MSISNAELVLREDGSIYHLGLHPEDISDVIITVGDPDRVALVAVNFDKILVEKRHREFVTCTGLIGNQKYTVIATGIGTDNIDIVLNELDALANISFVDRKIKSDFTQLTFVRIGTCGSINADLDIDEIAVSAGAIGLDGLLHFYDEPKLIESDQLLDWDINWPVRPYFEWSNQELLNMFDNIGMAGITMTNCGFYGPQGRSLRLRPFNKMLPELLSSYRIGNYPFLNLEMETSAIYALSRMMGHRAISLNSILANRVKGTFTTDTTKTIKRLITLTFEKLKVNH